MKIKLCICAIIGMLLFIWGNSAMPGAVSNVVSNRVTEAVGGQIIVTEEDKSTATTWLTSSHIRKFAHLAEFAALGLAAALFVLFRGEGIGRKLPSLLLLGMGVALIDETIQLFSNRTSMLKDVWLDLLGFGIGLLFAWLLSAGIRYRKGRISQRS